MGKSTAAANELLQYLFNKVAMSDVDGTNTLYVAYHTADPGVGGSQTTSEAAYSGYDRMPITRNGTGGWTVSTNTVKNANLVQFPICGVTGATLKYVSIGTAAYPTAGVILYSGQLGADLVVSQNIQPQFLANGLNLTEN